MTTPDRLTIYVPREDSILRRTLEPGTAVVGSDARAWLAAKHGEDVDDAERIAADVPLNLLLDLEAPGPAANIVTFADRCYHAYDRHVRHFPTHKRQLAASGSLWAVGFYYAPEGRVQIDPCGPDLSHGQALYKLGEWVGHPVDAAGAASDLDREFRTTHTRTFRAL